MGLKIDRTPGERHKHDTKPVYQEKQELKRQQKEWKKKMEKEKLELKIQKAEVEKQKIEILITSDRNTKKEVELLERDKILSQKIDFFKSRSELVHSFECTAEEVKNNNLSFEKIEAEFWANEKTHPLKQRISNFLKGCKKVVTHLSLQLSEYKQAFERFWKWKPKQFRELADSMEKLNCKITNPILQ